MKRDEIIKHVTGADVLSTGKRDILYVVKYSGRQNEYSQHTKHGFLALKLVNAPTGKRWVSLPSRMAALMALACFPEEPIW